MVKSATHTSVVNAIEMIEKATTLEQARIGLQKAERALKKAASKGIYPVERANRKTSRIAARVSKKFSKPQVTSTQK